MQVIVHYPSSVEGIKSIEQNVAKIHASSVASYINQQNYSRERSEKLINMICDRIKQK